MPPKEDRLYDFDAMITDKETGKKHRLVGENAHMVEVKRAGAVLNSVTSIMAYLFDGMTINFRSSKGGSYLKVIDITPSKRHTLHLFVRGDGGLEWEVRCPHPDEDHGGCSYNDVGEYPHSAECFVVGTTKFRDIFFNELWKGVPGDIKLAVDGPIEVDFVIERDDESYALLVLPTE